MDQNLRRNVYPGRGLVVGRADVDETWLMIYWIMGRSDHSRNRRFVVEGSTLRTEPVNAERVEDPSLIIYEAMLELPGVYLASNGDQTRTIAAAVSTGGSFESALAIREREPDRPNYTPRISAMLDCRDAEADLALSVLKANPAAPERTDRHTFRPYAPPPGLGLALTTYSGDGNPLPSFQGEPLFLPCAGTPESVLDTYWDALNPDNRISVAVKSIGSGDSNLLVRNRF